MKTVIVWFRNDLRVNDHPALATAAASANHVVPVFILNDQLLTGKNASSNRNRFLLECLFDLKKSLQTAGADLVVRHGDTAAELLALASETGATSVYCTADYTPYSLARDKQIKKQLEAAGIEFRLFSGRLAVSNFDKLVTKTGTPYKVFTPFFNTWLQVPRRELAPPLPAISLPTNVTIGSVPAVESITVSTDLSPDVLRGGETAARARLQNFIDHDIADYKQASNDMAADSTSRLSPYLHFGCLSPLETERLLPNNNGARAWNRQLAWREFYHYIIFTYPANKDHEFQERYRGTLSWTNNQSLLTAWQQGVTGYPVVDAAMRQLNQEGWMHNRARLIVGSFLTKDLWIDWRQGEAYFWKMLLDGDVPNNNGNWQWIASVGVDPAPVFRRLYNPTSQQKNYDPTGAYVRRYVPELANVPDNYLAEPWTMPSELQDEIGCKIGKDYPEPIVDHKLARQNALDHYRAVAP